MAPKRRLPVLGDPPRPEGAPPDGAAEPEGDDDVAPRPPWHWVAFGAVTIFAAWLPLATVAQLVSARVAASFVGRVEGEADVSARVAELAPGDAARLQISIVLVYVLALAGGAAAGGYLVGRWGHPAGPREAALAGVVAGLSACALAAWAARDVGAALVASALVAALVGGGASWAGSRAGARRRRDGGLLPG